MPQENISNGTLCHFLLIMNYSIIFLGNSPYSNNIFWLQRKVLRIITRSRTNDSCQDLFRKLNIFPLQSQYIFFTIIFRYQEGINTS